MPRYILNTTYGEWSAGTEVEIINGSDDAKELTVAPICGDMSDDFFDIPSEFLTKRRNRTDEIALPNREERRKDDPMVEARRETWISSQVSTT